MVSYFISLIESRYSIDDAVKIGTQRRLRPMLMTAFKQDLDFFHCYFQAVWGVRYNDHLP